jgi:hypothetical protein
MFQFPWLATYTYVFSARSWRFTPTGFPIRKSPDHSLFSSFPELIAAIHVLHRLSIPGHSLYALSSLTPYHSRILPVQISKLDILPYAIVKDRMTPPLRRKNLSQIDISLEPSNFPGAKLVGPGRVELPTSRLSGVRSNQLSYRPA